MFMALLSFSTSLSPPSLLPSFRRVTPTPSLHLHLRSATASAAGGNGVALRAVSSSSKKSKSRSSDSALVHALDAELATDADDVSSSLPVPDNFPFSITDTPGKTTITLFRTYKSEEISVVVSLPDEESTFGSFAENDDETEFEDEQEEEDEDEEDGDDEVEDIEDLEDAEEMDSASIAMTVTVSKSSGKRLLEFECRGYEDKVEIDGVRVREGGEEEEEGDAYEGPYFEELEDNLKKAFRKYLAARGITPEVSQFLMEYMGSKEEKEYRLWLRRVKEFIKS